MEFNLNIDHLIALVKFVIPFLLGSLLFSQLLLHLQFLALLMQKILEILLGIFFLNFTHGQLFLAL